MSDRQFRVDEKSHFAHDADPGQQSLVDRDRLVKSPQFPNHRIQLTVADFSEDGVKFAVEQVPLCLIVVIRDAEEGHIRVLGNVGVHIELPGSTMPDPSGAINDMPPMAITCPAEPSVASRLESKLSLLPAASKDTSAPLPPFNLRTSAATFGV